ncbi:LacI family DNA-binding transcriptional regulator [Curtobacterium flaccumfaciens]|nr:LacI family DNA-binding transcriptional regulator [Curtobacterium flaccumfaciens]
MTSTDRRGPDATLGDVAVAAGVSRATVSRAFSRPDLISDETVRRVKAAAEKLGYVGNDAARALKTGRFRNIAIVVPDIANPFFPPMLRAAQNRADELGYAVFLGDSDERAERERTLLSRLSGQVEGFVLAGTRLDRKTITALVSTRPTVLINRDIPTIPRVLIDSARGIAEAVEHLAGLGHRRIAYVAGPTDAWADQQRRGGVRRTAERLGLGVSVIEAGRPTFTAGVETAGPLATSGATAAIAFDDVLAHGLLAGLATRGLRVPADMSVIGCDDTLATSTEPPLTTISEAATTAGTRAVDTLIGLLDDRPQRARRLTVDTHLIVRSTTAAPRARRA